MQQKRSFFSALENLVYKLKKKVVFLRDDEKRAHDKKVTKRRLKLI